MPHQLLDLLMGKAKHDIGDNIKIRAFGERNVTLTNQKPVELVAVGKKINENAVNRQCASLSFDHP